MGINTLILSQSGGSEGLGFAAPSNIVKNVYEQIRAHGRVRRGELGIVAQTITPLIAKGLGLSQLWGVVLADVFPGGSAHREGLRAGDILLTLEGKLMENGRQFDVNLYRHEPGDTVSLEVQRGSKMLQFQVEVKERKADLNRFAYMVSAEKNLVVKLGILGIDLDASLVPMFVTLRSSSGVVVAAQAVDAPMGRGSFLPGDVIYAINGVPVINLEGLRSALAKLQVYDAVVVQIERLGRFMYIAFELE